MIEVTVIRAAATRIIAAPAEIRFIASAASLDTAVVATLSTAGAQPLIAAARATETVIIMGITAMVTTAVADTSASQAFTWNLVVITDIDSKLIG